MCLSRRWKAVAFCSGLTFAGLTISPATAQTGQYDGVNWADPRDNFANDELVLSGLLRSDSYNTVKAKSEQFTRQFYSKLGANTIRIPINPATTSSAWWSNYRGVIDGIRAAGSNVIIAYWEGTGRDGRIDDRTKFDAMWGTVIAAYGSNGGILFEPMNEPHGYSLADWSGIAASWVNRFTSVPKSRVIIDGQGYSEDVRGVCADSRLNGTRLSLHNYGFWANRTYDQWLTDWRNRIGNCASRTIITEFGTTMNGGQNFNGSSSDNGVMYMQAGAKVARDLGLGAVYWPGLRDGDSYSMTTRSGSGTTQTLNVVNASGRDNLRWAWGM